MTERTFSRSACRSPIACDRPISAAAARRRSSTRALLEPLTFDDALLGGRPRRMGAALDALFFVRALDAVRMLYTYATVSVMPWAFAFSTTSFAGMVAGKLRTKALLFGAPELPAFRFVAFFFLGMVDLP